MKYRSIIFFLFALTLVSCRNTASEKMDEPFFKMRGIILSWTDVQNPEVIDWIDIARSNNLNTISVFTPNSDYTSPEYLSFKKKCIDVGLDFEYQEHVMQHLLPRELYETHPEYFRMDENGVRLKDGNGCPSNREGLEVIASNVAAFAKNHMPTNHKYYFWLNDGGDICHCEKCSKYNASDQALIYENKIIRALKVFDPKATLCHLAYHTTTPAPQLVKPEKDIFLEFAPFYRRLDKPLCNRTVMGTDNAGNDWWTHGEYLDMLDDNLKLFPTETAQVLEYWIDVSKRSNWKKPAVKLDWHKDVFLSDLETYASYGIRNVTAYAVYVDEKYVKDYKDISFVSDYASGLLNYEKK